MSIGSISPIFQPEVTSTEVRTTSSLQIQRNSFEWVSSVKAPGLWKPYKVHGVSSDRWNNEATKNHKQLSVIRFRFVGDPDGSRWTPLVPFCLESSRFDPGKSSLDRSSFAICSPFDRGLCICEICVLQSFQPKSINNPGTVRKIMLNF